MSHGQKVAGKNLENVVGRKRQNGGSGITIHSEIVQKKNSNSVVACCETGCNKVCSDPGRRTGVSLWVVPEVAT